MNRTHPPLLFSHTVVDCGSPGSPANGTIQQLTGTQYGFTVSYTCNVGYSLEGAASRVCQEDGQWSEAVPVCRGEFLCIMGYLCGLSLQTFLRLIWSKPNSMPVLVAWETVQ